MANRSSSASKKLDGNQLAHRIARIASGEPVPDLLRPRRKNPAAVALGRRGGLKGGKARAAALTAAQRSAIGKKGAAARWNKAKP
jgi:hypothetical protein